MQSPPILYCCCSHRRQHRPGCCRVLHPFGQPHAQHNLCRRHSASQSAGADRHGHGHDSRNVWQQGLHRCQNPAARSSGGSSNRSKQHWQQGPKEEEEKQGDICRRAGCAQEQPQDQELGTAGDVIWRRAQVGRLVGSSTNGQLGTLCGLFGTIMCSSCFTSTLHIELKQDRRVQG